MERIYPGTPLYNHSNTLRLPWWPDRAAVESAIRVLMNRHDALRLRIVEAGDEPFQEDCGDLEVPLAWHDLRGLPAEEARLRSDGIAVGTARALFRLDAPPLFRVTAILLPDAVTLLVCTFHHITVDGWSLGRFCEDLHALLSGRQLRPAPGVGYLDFVAWQRSQADESGLACQLDYWRGKLAGELPVLDVPKDRPRQAASASREGRLITFTLPRDSVERLKRFADSEQTTLFVVLLAAYKVLLLRLTGQSDIIIGVPFAGREHPAAEHLCGSFVNMVALRTDLGGNPSFRDAVRRVRATTLEAYDNQSVPFERVVEELRVSRELHQHPIFQVQFALQNMPSSRAPDAEVTDDLDTGTSKFDLTLSLKETASGADALMEYSSELFDEPTARRYVEMYVRLVDALVARPDLPLSRYGLLSAEERHRIVYGLNTPVPREITYRTLAEPFEHQVRCTPEAVALAGDEGELTYRELNESANRLAHLLREMGVEQGGIVAVCMERSFAMVVALYAIAKSGAAYMPLDPDLPAERLKFMLEDTGAGLVLTHAAAEAKVPAGGWRVLNMNGAAHLLARQPTTDMPCGLPPHHLAYLMYTSGSTGRPKAVAFPVDAAIASMLWLQRNYPTGEGDGQVLKTPYGFDVSVWEIFWPLYVGSTLIVCRPGGHRDPAYLVELIERHRVAAINFVPSMLQVFLDEMQQGSCRSIRWVLCGGEPMTPWLRDTCHARLPATLVNLYGPTETHAVTDMIIEPNEGCPTVPLGRPSGAFRLYVLDEELEPKPIGVPGELYIGADVGPAHGYHGRPDLTAERFLPDPFGPPGSRMYRTGDICRYHDDGVLDHLGRCGTQVKVLGMRVELAEIEAVLCEHEAVESCVTLALGHDAGQRLVAFVVPSEGARLDPQELALHAGRFLPRFMVPSSFVGVERIPTTINGKVDRDMLAARWREAGAASAPLLEPPRGRTEERLKRIYEQVLGLPAVGVTDSFFELGGHSLLVFKLIAACEQEFGVRLAVWDVFSAASVRELACLLDSASDDMDRCLIPLAPAPGKPLIAFVHAAGGSALPFLEVARHLEKDFSVYGLQAPGVDDAAAEPCSSVEQYTELYLKLLDKVRGYSPVVLAGWSFGGNVAVEMTRRWKESGVEVAATLLLDSWVADRSGPSGGVCEETARAVRRIDFLAQEGSAAAAEGAADLPWARLRRVLEANVGAFLRYEPAWFDGEVDLLRAVEPFPATAGEAPASYLSRDRGWGRHVRRVVVHDVGGHHFDMVAAENAASLAKKIRAIAEARLSSEVI
jgi:amino acid adenylation domain-containing protein